MALIILIAVQNTNRINLDRRESIGLSSGFAFGLEVLVVVALVRDARRYSLGKQIKEI
jgi:hypothetical protein